MNQQLNLLSRWAKYKIVFWFIVATKLIEVFILEKMPSLVQELSQNKVWPYSMYPIIAVALVLHFICYYGEYGLKLKKASNVVKTFAIFRWIWFIPESVSIIVIFLSIGAIVYNIETPQFMAAVNNEVVYGFFFVPLIDFWFFCVIDKKLKNSNAQNISIHSEMTKTASQRRRLVTIIILLTVGSAITSCGFYDLWQSSVVSEQSSTQPTPTSNIISAGISEYPNQDWLSYFSIDREPLNGQFAVNNDIVFRVFATTTHPVSEFYVTIFHSDFKDNFKTTHNLAEDNSQNPIPIHVPLYKNDWVINTIMNYTGFSNPMCASYLNQTNYTTNENNGECDFSYNGLVHYSFEYPGNYMVQFAIKEKNGIIRTYESPMTIFNIPDPKEVQLENNVDRIYNIAQISQVTSIRGEGLSFIALGSSLIIAGVSMRDTMIANEKWLKQEEEKKSRIKNLIKLLGTPLTVIDWQGIVREDRAKEFNQDHITNAENETLILESEVTLARAADELKMARQLSLLPTEIEELLRRVTLEATKKLSKNSITGNYFLLNHQKLKSMIDELEKALRKFEQSLG